MEVDYLNGLLWCLAPAQDTPAVEEGAEPRKTPTNPAETVKEKLTVGEIAQLHGWKVGRKEVRVIGHGDVPDHPIEENGWLLMRAIDYEGIVPQEALDRVRTLLVGGVEIKGLLIADDLHKHKPGKLRSLALRARDRVRTIDWQKRRSAATQRVSALTSASSAAAESIAGGVKDKAKEVNWARGREVLGKGLMVVAGGAAIISVVAVALPILALVAIPTAALVYDPWLIVVDSENRRWVVAEWFD